MDAARAKRWPPPPDLESIRELVRTADPEGHLAEGAHADEYEPEENAILEAIGHLDTPDLLATTTRPLIEAIWQKSFGHENTVGSKRTKALAGLAHEIERFFGPQAVPQVRSTKNRL